METGSAWAMPTSDSPASGAASVLSVSPAAATGAGAGGAAAGGSSACEADNFNAISAADSRATWAQPIHRGMRDMSGTTDRP